MIPQPACIRPRGAGMNWADLLDRLAMEEPDRTPLVADPRLYAAFADDRADLNLARMAQDAADSARYHSTDRIRPCIDCRRMTRSTKTPKQYAPGTVVRHSADRCTSCYRRHLAGKPPALPSRRVQLGIVPCAGCGTPTRPSNGKTIPGTTRRIKHGLCWPCITAGVAE